MMGQNLASSAGVVPSLGGEASRHQCCEVLSDGVRSMDSGRGKLRIPRPRHLLQRNPGMHYHFRPEIFVQMQGFTRFRFSMEEFLLSPGEMAIVPTGLPHAEKVLAGNDGAPFRCLIVGFCSSSVSMHFTVDSGAGCPGIESIRFYSTPDRRRIIEQVEYIVLLYHSGGSHASIAVRGMGLGLLAVLADLAHTETPDAHHESPRIFRIKWLVRDQLCNPALNVAFLAQRLECASDYLSHVFHKETGETLIHYIHRQRMAGAIHVLSNHPELTISEIAWACGFVDAGYFTRVFRKHTGFTPLEYRRRAGLDLWREDVEPSCLVQPRVVDEVSAGTTLSR
jgi:AraC-like DNA-binding protein